MDPFTSIINLSKNSFLLTVTVALFLILPSSTLAAEELDYFDTQVLAWAQKCSSDVTKQFELLLVSGTLTVGQVFDTFYIPIPNTNPQKYNTQYDRYSDENIRPILDSYLKKHSRIIFVIAVDRNGYLPTHNTRYTQPMTGNSAHDIEWNRTKRIFNDTTGLAAAKNRRPYILQKYLRDTGEWLKDLSVPILINDRHWGAVRISYK